MGSPSFLRRIGPWLGLVVSIALLVGIAYFTDAAQWLDVLLSVRLSQIAIAAALLLVFLVTRALRWRLLLVDQDSEPPIAILRLVHIQNAGYMLNSILPLRAGEFARISLVASLFRVPLGRSAASVLIERMLDLASMVGLLILGVIFVPVDGGSLLRSALFVGAAAVAVLLVLLSSARAESTFVTRMGSLVGRLPGTLGTRLAPHIREFALGARPLAEPLRAIAVLLLTAAMWLPIIYAYMMIANSVQLTISPSEAAVVVAVTGLSIAIPSAPSYAGVFHTGAIFALNTLLGRELSLSVAFAFLYHAFNTILAIAAGLVGLALIGLSARSIRPFLPGGKSAKVAEQSRGDHREMG